jgi:hypothetical protein
MLQIIINQLFGVFSLGNVHKSSVDVHQWCSTEQISEDNQIISTFHGGLDVSQGTPPSEKQWKDSPNFENAQRFTTHQLTVIFTFKPSIQLKILITIPKRIDGNLSN